MTRRVLVVRFSSLGDVVLAAPVFTALKKRLGAVHITFLTKNQYAELHRANPHLDEVWSLDPQKDSLSSVIEWVKKGEFNLMVDLHRSLRSRFISLRAGVSVSRYKQERWRRFWIVARPRFGSRRGVRPVVERYLEAVGWCGALGKEPDTVPQLYLTDKVLEQGREWKKEMLQGREGRLISILPGAKHPPKQWSATYFSELSQMLAWRGDVPVLVSPPDIPGLASDIVAMVGTEGIGFSEPLGDVMQLAAALAASDAVVTNDSGPMHVAAAVGTRVVGLFGPTSPELGFAPLGPSAAWIHLGHFCSPCSKHGRRPCWRGKRFCLLELKPELVIDALDDLFQWGQS